MLQVIPAIDIIGGRAVRLTQGDYGRAAVYDAAPEDMAREFLDAGFRRIHCVDLDGARASSPANLPTLQRIAAIGGLTVEWGGGLKTEQHVAEALDAGAAYGIIGSTAAREPETFERWLDTFGGSRLILGADVRDGRVAVAGWQEETDLTIADLVSRFLPHGLRQMICTDITRDGMLSGPATSLYTDLQRRWPALTTIVSGGVSSVADLERLDSLGLRAAIVGKAIYEHRITLSQLSKWSQSE